MGETAETVVLVDPVCWRPCCWQSGQPPNRTQFTKRPVVSSYAGGFGGFNFREWWDGFREGIDPYMRFLAAFLVLCLFPVMVDLISGGWQIIPQVLRLDSGSRQLQQLERAEVV
jgi:hypothetical protein